MRMRMEGFVSSLFNRRSRITVRIPRRSIQWVIVVMVAIRLQRGTDRCHMPVMIVRRASEHARRREALEGQRHEEQAH